MKKLITSILAAALLCSMSVTAFAASPITTVNGTDSANVKGTYKAGSTAATVYSVDVAWDSMTFTYTAGSAGTWNPATHENDGATNGVWSETNNSITVTNHSNVAVDATLSYTKETAYSAVSGTFTETSGAAANDNKLELLTADGTKLASAPTATATLNLSGTLAEGVTNQKVGTVTVTITNHFAVEAGEGGLID